MYIYLFLSNMVCNMHFFKLVRFYYYCRGIYSEKYRNFFSLVLKSNHNSFMPRHKFLSCILFNTSVILLTILGNYSSIHYSTMLRRNRIGYSHKSDTGHDFKKRRCSVISAIPGRHPSDRNSLVDTPLPPPILPDTAAAVVVVDPDRQPVVHMSSQSSIITVLNADSVHPTSSLRSMTYTSSNGDGILSTSSARLPETSNSPLNT